MAYDLAYEDDYVYEIGGNNTNNSVLCYYIDEKNKVLCDGEEFESSQYYSPGEALFFIYLGAYIAATLFAGEFILS